MKNAFWIVLFLLLSCGGTQSGGAAGGGSAKDQAYASAACQGGKLDGNFQNTSVILSFYKCGFSYSNGSCQVNGNMITQQENQGTAEITVASSSGCSGSVPTTSTCQFILSGQILGFTCASLGISGNFAKVN